MNVEAELRVVLAQSLHHIAQIKSSDNVGEVLPWASVFLCQLWSWCQAPGLTLDAAQTGWSRVRSLLWSILLPCHLHHWSPSLRSRYSILTYSARWRASSKLLRMLVLSLSSLCKISQMGHYVIVNVHYGLVIYLSLPDNCPCRLYEHKSCSWTSRTSSETHSFLPWPHLQSRTVYRGLKLWDSYIKG